jgi:hypothetical protein
VIEDSNAPTCVICNTDRPATYGFVCIQHHERVAQWLHEVEVEAAILSPVKSMQVASGNRGAGLASERSPVRLDAIVMRDRRRGTGTPISGEQDPWGFDATPSILDVLGSWARLVREERDLAGPERVTVTSERRTLSTQWDWICGQAWVDEFVSELRNLRSALKASNGTSEPRRKAVGLCPTLLDDGECGGKLWPDEKRGDVVCASCDRVFVPDELRHLGEMLIRQGYVEVFRAEWFTGVPAGTIRRWVAEGKCTSEKDGRKLMVQIGEIEQLRDRNKRRSGVAS